MNASLLPLIMNVGSRLLLVDSDSPLLGVLLESVLPFLKSAGIEVYSASGIGDVLTQMRITPFSAALIPRWLTNGDGVDALRVLSNRADFPLIGVLPVRDSIDELLFVEAGADIVIVPPIDGRLFLAYWKSLLRRSRPPEQGKTVRKNVKYAFGPWLVDSFTFSLTHITLRTTESLGPAEYQLLRIFLSSANRILSRGQILELLGEDRLALNERAIDVRVARLRQKIESNPRQPEFLLTVRSAGYCFQAEVSMSDKDVA